MSRQSVYREQLRCPFKAVRGRRSQLVCSVGEIEKNEYRGYITNCGTEGNLHGVLVGREVFPDGILYASRESHYSIFKAAKWDSD
ncbi:hypothetical protein ACFX13_047144 [Malus domestica]